MTLLQATDPIAMRKRTSHCLRLFTLSASLIVSNCALSLPTNDVSARFRLSAQGFEIATVDWRMTPGSSGEHVYESISQSVGVARLIRNEQVTERSRWRLSNGVVEPLEYAYSRRGGKRVRDASVRFDWNSGSAHGALNGNGWESKLEPGMQDKLSYLLSLMNRLERGQQLVPISVHDGAKNKRYHFRQIGKDSVDTAVGRVDTVQVERRVDGDGRVTVVWMAPGLGYFPVKIVHKEDGETVTLTLESLEGVSAR